MSEKKSKNEKAKKKNIFREIAKSISKGVVFAYCKIVYKVKIIGKENIPKEGALIFCGNHRTYLDPPLIIVTAGRDMRFIAKEELKSNPIIRIMLTLFDGIYVKRDAKDIASVKESLKTLKSGECIGIFPEGGRNSLEENSEGKLKNGAVYMALKTGAKVIPVGIVGESKPFTKNAIIYGKPIDFSEYKALDKSAEDKASEVLKEEILKLSSTEIWQTAANEI